MLLARSSPKSFRDFLRTEWIKFGHLGANLRWLPRKFVIYKFCILRQPYWRVVRRHTFGFKLSNPYTLGKSSFFKGFTEKKRLFVILQVRITLKPSDAPVLELMSWIPCGFDSGRFLVIYVSFKGRIMRPWKKGTWQNVRRDNLLPNKLEGR